MTYSYLEITPTIHRPIIDIIVKSNEKFAIYPVLIDSGADYCIFNVELAHSFGINLSKATVNLSGVGKNRVSGKWAEIEIRIANKNYRARVLFAEISQFSHGILGQNGFFDHFDINFSLNKQTIEVMPIKEIH